MISGNRHHLLMKGEEEWGERKIETDFYSSNYGQYLIYMNMIRI